MLASSSSYFQAMFHMEFEESRQKRIIIQEVDPKALRLLLDYIYTSEIKVNEQNVQVWILNLEKKTTKHTTIWKSAENNTNYAFSYVFF